MIEPLNSSDDHTNANIIIWCNYYTHQNRNNFIFWWL